MAPAGAGTVLAANISQCSKPSGRLRKLDSLVLRISGQRWGGTTAYALLE